MSDKKPTHRDPWTGKETEVSRIAWWESGPIAGIIVGVIVGASRGLHEGLVYGVVAALIGGLFYSQVSDACIHYRQHRQQETANRKAQGAPCSACPNGRRSEDVPGNPDREDLRELADTFLTLLQSKELTHRPTVPIRSLSLEDAYEVQRLVIEARTSQDEHPIGYKVGCTSKAIRQQFGLVEPICGRLMSPHVYHGHAELQCEDFVNCAVEPEFVFAIARDLEVGALDLENLENAIEYVSPGIEVHHYKFWLDEPTSQELIASNGIHACLVVGEERVEPKDINWESESISLFLNDELVASGVGAEIMGSPLTSLRWLVRHLSRSGGCLKAGDLVIPGSPVGLISVNPGDAVRAEFAHFGTVVAWFR